ncbi:MAG TPA: hypothetical protein PL033_01010 [Candidatus Brocadiia bacterium]|nr:hypothetical protein [Candidatus Brocadiia bacterium]
MASIAEKADLPAANRRLQLVLAAAGTIALCAFWQWAYRENVYWSSKRWVSFLYDVPAALSMCSFMAQAICEGLCDRRSPGWRARLAALIPLIAIPVGRTWLGWMLSGHLANAFSGALIQSAHERASKMEKLLYWIPIPIVLAIRWPLFDKPGHGESLRAACAAVAIFAGYGIIHWFLAKRRNADLNDALHPTREAMKGA